MIVSKFESFTTKRSNTEDFIQKSKNVHDDKYDYSLVEYKNNNTKVKIICPIHGVFEQIPRSHISGIGCYKCGKGTINRDIFIQKSIEKHGDKYNYSLVDDGDFSNMKKVEIVCPQHGSFFLQPKLHMCGVGCSKCAGNRKLTTEEFIEMSKKKYASYNFDYTKTKYTGYNNSLTIICPKHGDFEVIPALHLNGTSVCNLCKKSKTWNFDYFRDCANLTHGNKYEYFSDDFVNSITKTKILCKKHGLFYQRPDSHVIGAGCPICKESRGERVIANFLDKFNIKYERSKKFDDCKLISKLPFDFYLSDYNICVEFDGIQHFEPRDRFGGIEEFNKVALRDAKKTQYCLDNNIRLIRISKISDIEEKLRFLWEQRQK